RETLATPASRAPHRRRRDFSWHCPLRPDALCRAATESSVFPAAVEGAVEVASKSEPRRAAAAEPRALGKIRRDPPGLEEDSRPGAVSGGASAQEICEQRSASRVLHER